MTTQQGYNGCPIPRSYGILFSLFLVLGCCFLLLPVWADAVAWRVNHRYRETQCVVLNRRIEQGGVPDTQQGGTVGSTIGYRPLILIQYQVDSHSYRTWTYDSPPSLRVHFYGSCAEAQSVLDGFSVGHAYPCWYDPEEPGEAVLVRGYQSFWWLLFPWPFILIGGLGLTWLFFKRRTRHQEGGQGQEAQALSTGRESLEAPREDA